MSELSNKIYNDTYSNLINGVDEKYIKEISNGYHEYLDIRFKDYSVDDADVFIELMNKKLLRNDPNIRLSMFVKDSEYEKIACISQEGLNKACLYAENLLSRNDSNPLINKDELVKVNTSLRSSLSKVKEFNKEAAKQLISEGVLDYEFASGNIDFMSFRLSHRYGDLLRSTLNTHGNEISKH